MREKVAVRARALLHLLLLAVAALMICSEEASAEDRKRVTWQGVETFEEAYLFSGRISAHLGNLNEYFHKITVRFTYVEETDAEGTMRWVSRKIDWDAKGGALARDFTVTTCEGSGSIELGPTGYTFGSPDHVTAAQRERLKIPCETTDFGILAGGFKRPPDRIEPPPLLVNQEGVRDGCAYSEERPGYRYSVSVHPGCKCNPDSKATAYRVTFDALLKAFVEAFRKRGIEASSDLLQIGTDSSRGSITFMIRLGENYNLLPAPHWLSAQMEKDALADGSQEGSKYVLLGMMQAAPSLCRVRVNTRIVRTQTGVVFQTGKGNGDLTPSGLERAVDIALAGLGVEFEPYAPLARP